MFVETAGIGALLDSNQDDQGLIQTACSQKSGTAFFITMCHNETKNMQALSISELESSVKRIQEHEN
jgi:hypothetical protein